MKMNITRSALLLVSFLVLFGVADATVMVKTSIYGTLSSYSDNLNNDPFFNIVSQIHIADVVYDSEGTEMTLYNVANDSVNTIFTLPNNSTDEFFSDATYLYGDWISEFLSNYGGEAVVHYTYKDWVHGGEGDYIFRQTTFNSLFSFVLYDSSNYSSGTIRFYDDSDYSINYSAYFENIELVTVAWNNVNVPEPSSINLFSIGVLFFIGVFKKRKWGA